jgi:hypothetical protein
VGDGPQDYLFLFVAGNLQGGNNFGGNRLQLFFDSGIAGGVNQIPAGLPPIDGLGGSTGLKFDAGFNATHYASIGLGYNESLGAFQARAAFAKLAAPASGGIIGAGPSLTAIVGAGSACPPDQAIAVGSEIDAVYSYVDNSSRTLWLMITGNIKPDEFIQLFFDVNGNPAGDEGQNRLNGAATFGGGRTRNVAIGIADGGFGSINRMGDDGTGALQFDAGFYADYYLNTHVENVNRQVIDAAVLRTVGRFETGAPDYAGLDFGAYQGKDIPNEINFDGTNFDNLGVGQILYPNGIGLQSGTIPDVYAAFAPREAYRVLKGFRDNHAGAFPASVAEWTDWLGFTNSGNPQAPASLRPRGGLIRSRLDNSNIAGVTSSPGPDGSTATKGFELAISLEELGWDPHSRIRVAGFLIRSGFSQIGNQVLGDPAGMSDLGEPRAVNFSAIGGNQYVVVGSCLADYNGVNNVDLLDIFAFLSDWFANVPKADVNAQGGVELLDIFYFLGLWFEGPCRGG